MVVTLLPYPLGFAFEVWCCPICKRITHMLLATEPTTNKPRTLTIPKPTSPVAYETIPEKRTDHDACVLVPPIVFTTTWKARNHSGDKRHLLNLGKYASSLLVVIVSMPGWPLWNLGSEETTPKGADCRTSFMWLMRTIHIAMFEEVDVHGGTVGRGKHMY